MKIARLLLLLSVAAGAAYAQSLQSRSDALRAHIRTHGTDMGALASVEFLTRCELALDLLETPMQTVDSDWGPKVYAPWRSILRSQLVQDRLKAIQDKGEDPAKRGPAITARAAKLPVHVGQSNTTPNSGPSTTPSTGTGSAAAQKVGVGTFSSGASRGSAVRSD
jgi:hypothetical protein